MTELNRAGVDESLGHIDTTQGEFRDQIDVVADELRQLAGNADVPGDALSAPYVLYVNGYTGKDTFVGGDYYTQVNSIEERISLQRLECGYTEARPFRTINRAALEAAIITSHEDFATDAERGRALVSIQVAPGEYTVLNGNGLADTDANFPARATGFEPTDAELQSFNDPTTGGVILPRGTSLVSLDLRKTILRPGTVPAVANEAANYGNRRSILKVTGTGYFYGFTFKDQAGSTASHHLLSCFEFTPQAQLDTLYSKIRKSFAFMDISDANAVTQEKEYQIVGAQPVNPVPAVDTVGSASPYIYNISNRSILGLCGIFADGDNSAGFRSMVVAQYTGVSLQTDFSCWQVYNQGTNTWGAAGSQQNVIDAEPDDVRMHPSRRSFHIRAVNNSVIQEVSVFAIGQGIHHWVENGGELTVTNSNSNWGGCAALAEGYHEEAAPGDTPFTPISVRRALSPFEKTQNVEKIFLGTIAAGVANNAVAIDLEDDLQESSAFPGQPAVLASRGYSLKNPDRIWVENPQGADYSAVLAATPWQANNPDRIVVTAAFETPGGDDPGSGDAFPDLEGRRIYVRRLVDTRTVEERTYSLKVSGNQARRLPIRDYVLRDAADSWATNRLSSVSRSTLDKTGADLTADVVLRNANHTAGDLTHAATTYYHKGDPIIRNRKHLTAVRDNYGAFDANDWSENFVHMEDDFAPEGVVQNSYPIIIFDGDTQNAEPATNCGFAIGTPVVEAQYESGTDYKGMQYYLTTAGIAINLTPATAANRDAAIAGGANIEFRRPSNIRLFGHAYEWAGFLNYSKALPQYQGDLSPTNKFTYYFTNEEGGKVYASGFNEEGFAVTPQGLQDIETGEVRSVVDIGSPDVVIPEPPELPQSATTELEGLVELATEAEVQTAIQGNPPLTGSSGPLVLQPNAIPLIIGGVGLLIDGETILYVNGGVTRASVNADATVVPAAVTARYNANAAIHGTTTVNRVAFRSLRQALEFINGRDPITRDELIIEIVGDSDADPGTCRHSSLRPLTIRGTTQSRTGSRAFIGGTLVGTEGAGELTVRDCTIAATGTIANPTARDNRKYALYVNNGLVLKNCKITNNSTQFRAMAISYKYSEVLSERAYCHMLYEEDYQTTIELDTSANGNYDRGGYADNIFGDFLIKGFKGDNQLQNKLIIRASATDANVAEHRQLCFGQARLILSGYLPESQNPAGFNGYGNWDLEIEFDYGGTQAVRAAFEGIRDEFAFNTKEFGDAKRSNLEVTVTRGSINRWEGFKLGSNVTLTRVTDKYKNDDNPTVTEIFSEAWSDAGAATSQAIYVPLYNTYNGVFLGSPGDEIGSDFGRVIPEAVFADGPIDDSEPESAPPLD